MITWRDAIAPMGASLRDIVAVIDKAGVQAALICDDSGRLEGIITDGDVRRALLRGMSLDEPTTDIVNRQPMVIANSDGRARALALIKRFGVNQIPVMDDEGHVVGLETLFEHSSKEADDVTVVIMAGGLGSRLAPLTDTLPKPLIKVGDKPILETIVEKLAAHGFSDLYMCVNYKAEMIEGHFGDGANWDVNIAYIKEEERRGTAGALALLPERPKGPVVVLNGDLLTSVDFNALLEFHRMNGAPATMCVREYTVQVPYGVAELEGHHLAGLSEKPEHRFFINAGIYVLGPEAMDKVPASGFFDMTTLFEQLLETTPRPTVFPIREYWLDIGRIDDLERARREIDGVFKRL